MAGRSKDAIPLLEESLCLTRQVLREAPRTWPSEKARRVALTSLGAVYGETASYDAQRKCYVEAAELADADKDLDSCAEAYLLLAVSFRDDRKDAASDLRLADLVTAIRHFDTALVNFAEIAKAGPLSPAQGRLKALTEKLRKEAQASIADLKSGPAGKKNP